MPLKTVHFLSSLIYTKIENLKNTNITLDFKLNWNIKIHFYKNFTHKIQLNRCIKESLLFFWHFISNLIVVKHIFFIICIKIIKMFSWQWLLIWILTYLHLSIWNTQVFLLKTLSLPFPEAGIRCLNAVLIFNKTKY